MSQMPRGWMPDSTLFFVLEGYEFVSKRCRRYRSTVFETRLLLQKTICMLGEDAARVFYDTDRFERRGAAPMRMQKTGAIEEGVARGFGHFSCGR
ncbi:MAG: hypothetical protein GEU78_19770, partial [Actinobacteria bacterium]|nr:hypothetical protein [Actinomycetota bacterium]